MAELTKKELVRAMLPDDVFNSSKINDICDTIFAQGASPQDIIDVVLELLEDNGIDLIKVDELDSKSGGGMYFLTDAVFTEGLNSTEIGTDVIRAYEGDYIEIDDDTVHGAIAYFGIMTAVDEGEPIIILSSILPVEGLLLSTDDSVTATGVDQASAYQLDTFYAKITAGIANTGVLLIPAKQGSKCHVFNSSGSTKIMYATGIETIVDSKNALQASISMADGDVWECISFQDGEWSAYKTKA